MKSWISEGQTYYIGNGDLILKIFIRSKLLQDLKKKKKNLQLGGSHPKLKGTRIHLAGNQDICESQNNSLLGLLRCINRTTIRSNKQCNEQNICGRKVKCWVKGSKKKLTGIVSTLYRKEKQRELVKIYVYIWRILNIQLSTKRTFLVESITKIAHNYTINMFQKELIRQKIEAG